MARQGKLKKGGLKMADKEIRKKVKEALCGLGKIHFKENRSYDAVWLKEKGKKGNDNLVLCIFKGKKKTKICLPWSSKNVNIDKLPEIVTDFLKFKQSHSISKQIDILEKQLSEKGYI